MIFPVDLTLPDLPAALDGLRIAHLTDMHIRRRRSRYEAAVTQLSALRVDLIFLTGDYMSWPGDEPAAAYVMRQMVERLRATHGIFGVYGNHDTDELREQLAGLPVRWLGGQTHRPAGLPLELSGIDTDQHHFYDSLHLIERMHPPTGNGDAPLRLMLGHFPAKITLAADLGVRVLFAGHTHGGQCRLPGRIALRNSSDFPLRLTSGLLRHRDTLCAVSRGLGEVRLPFRTFCPPHVPVYTLRRGAMAGEHTHHVVNARPW